jgi:hypothetical protein
MSSIDRTYYPKHVTYTGDGSGRDGYVVFTDGGLEPTRNYKCATKTLFDNGTNLMPAHMTAPRKESTALEYIPDGTGRDTYIINAFGFKRDYKSNCNDYVHSLRSVEHTPVMDKRSLTRRNPNGKDISAYNYWLSAKDRMKNH